MGNSHIILIKKQIPTNTVNIAIKMGTLLITVSSTHRIHQIITIEEKRKILIISQETKIKIKRTSLNRKGSKRNFKSYNVNYEEQNNSNFRFRSFIRLLLQYKN